MTTSAIHTCKNCGALTPYRHLCGDCVARMSGRPKDLATVRVWVIDWVSAPVIIQGRIIEAVQSLERAGVLIHVIAREGLPLLETPLPTALQTACARPLGNVTTNVVLLWRDAHVSYWTLGMKNVLVDLRENGLEIPNVHWDLVVRDTNIGPQVAGPPAAPLPPPPRAPTGPEGQ